MLADGTKATVPDASIDKWMQRMDVRGVKFRDADMSADMTVGEPQVIKGGGEAPDYSDEVPRLASADNAPARAPDEIQVTPREDSSPSPSIGDRVVDGYRTLSDGAAAALDTATFGGSGKLMEAMGGMSQRDINARSPMATAIGSTGAAVFSPANKLGQGAGLAGSLIGNTATGLASGAHAAELEGKDPMQGGGWGAALGLLTGAGGEAVGSLTRGAGKLAGGIADRTRVAAAGIDANTRKELAKKFGVTDLPANLASMIERVTPSPRLGQSALTRAETLANRMDEVGPKIDQTLTEAGGQGLDAFIPGSWTDLQNKMSRGAGAAQSRAVTGSESAMGDALDRQASRLADQSAPANLVGLRQRNTGWGKSAYGDSSNISDSSSKLAAGELRDAGEASLDDIMTHALPETEQAFHGYNKDFGEAALLERAARTRAAVEAGETKMPGAVAAVGAGIANGVPGLVSGAASGTRNLLTQAIGGTRGLDVIANGLRAGERSLPAAGEAIRGASSNMTPLNARIAAALAEQQREEEEEGRY
jgi:hypothetical protein